MNILGVNFLKIEAERKEAAKGKINIKNNVMIKDISEVALAIGKQKQKVLRFLFEFTSVYDPDGGSITINGDLVLMDEQKKIEAIAASWKKDKKLTEDITAPLLNSILNKCNIEALILSQQIGLPPPIPLPKIDIQAKQK